MYFSMIEAAEQAGVSRSTIYRLVQEGKLSATTDRRGKKVIDIAEFIRIFGEPKQQTEHLEKEKKKDKKHTSGTQNETTMSHISQELTDLRSQLQIKSMELQLKEKELVWMSSRVEELRIANAQITEEKNKFIQIIERQTLLLTNTPSNLSTHSSDSNIKNVEEKNTVKRVRKNDNLIEKDDKKTNKKRK